MIENFSSHFHEFKTRRIRYWVEIKQRWYSVDLNWMGQEDSLPIHYQISQTPEEAWLFHWGGRRAVIGETAPRDCPGRSRSSKWLRSNCGSVGDHTFDTIGCIGAENLNEGWGFIKLTERTRSDSMTSAGSNPLSELRHRKPRVVQDRICGRLIPEEYHYCLSEVTNWIIFFENGDKPLSNCFLRGKIDLPTDLIDVEGSSIY